MKEQLKVCIFSKQLPLFLKKHICISIIYTTMYRKPESSDFVIADLWRWIKYCTHITYVFLSRCFQRKFSICQVCISIKYCCTLLSKTRIQWFFSNIWSVMIASNNIALILLATLNRKPEPSNFVIADLWRWIKYCTNITYYFWVDIHRNTRM